MKAVFLVALILGCGAVAQKSQQLPKPEDISQKIQGTVTIRNNDDSVRPAPFVEIRIYEPQRDGLTDLVGAWKSAEQKAREGSKGLSQFADTCQEVLLASLAGARINATYDRARKSGNWDEVKEQGLALYDSFYTDKDGNFEYNVGISGSSYACQERKGCVSPPSNAYGPLLLISFLNTPTTSYYWREQIKIREGEKTPPVVLADPVVCYSAEGAK